MTSVREHQEFWDRVGHHPNYFESYEVIRERCKRVFEILDKWEKEKQERKNKKMILNEVIEVLTNYQKLGFGNCDVVFEMMNNDSNLGRILAIDSVVEDLVLYDDEDQETLNQFDKSKNSERNENGHIILDQERLIKICFKEYWEIGSQKEEDLQENRKEEFNKKYGFLPIKERILAFLKKIGLGIGLGESRGFPPWKFEEILGGNFYDIRAALTELENENVIGYTGSTRGKRYVEIEYLEQAKQIFEREQNEKKTLQNKGSVHRLS